MLHRISRLFVGRHSCCNGKLKRSLSVGCLILLLGCSTANMLWAQLYSGSVTGMVTDPSKAVVPGAKVTFTDVGKGFEYKATTDATGRFLLRSIPPSTYQLKVEAEGFETHIRDGIALEVNQNANIDVTLKVRGTAQAIEVKGVTPLLSTQDAVTGQEVDRTFVDAMPLIGRGALDLAFLAPGVNPTPGGTFGSTNSEFSQNNFSSNGGRNSTADLLVDGGSVTSYEQNSTIQVPLYTPSVDDIQEFKIQQNNFGAEYGYSAGTIVNIVTRSGTNQFHGSAYEFLRNQVMDANNWFANRDGNKLPPLRYNDFGATFGGPIQKDKMFFFVDYEGTRQHYMSNSYAGVPSAAERAGDFGELCAIKGGVFDPHGQCTAANGQLWDPYTGVYDENVGGPVRSRFIPFNNLATYQSPGNPNLSSTRFQLPAVPGNLIDPAASKMMSYFPLPNLNVGAPNYDPYRNWTTSGVGITNHDQFDVRIDRIFSDKDNLSARFTIGRNPWHAAIAFPNAMDPNSSGPGNYGPRVLSLNEVHTFGPKTVLNLTFGFGRTLHQVQGPAADHPDFDPIKDLGLPAYMMASGYTATPAIEVDGDYAWAGPLNTMGSQPWSIQRYAQETYHMLGTLSRMQGRHEFKFGSEMRIHRLNTFQPGTPLGYFTFDRNTTSAEPNVGGDPMASFLTGVSTSGWGQYEIDVRLATQNYRFAEYFQDNWRVSEKLTLNLGVRYELETPRTERYNRMNSFDPNMPSPLKVPSMPDLRGGLVFASDQQRGFVDTNYKGIAPRFGLSYRLTPAMVLRGGYGVFFNPSQFGAAGVGTNGQEGFNATTNWNTTYQGDGATPWGRLSDPFPDGLVYPTGNTLGALTNVGTGIGAPIRTMNTLPYTQTWSFGLQYQLPGDVLIDANYVGTKGTHLYHGSVSQLNYLGPWVEKLTPDQIADLNTYVPNPFYGIITDPLVPLGYSPEVTKQQLLYRFPQYTGVSSAFQPRSNSSYNAFQLRVEKRFSKGLQFLMNYTISKSLDDSSVSANTTWLGGIQTTLVNPNNLRLERSVSQFDIPQVLNIAYVYDLPFGRDSYWGRNWNPWVNAFLGGWRTNGMWRFDNGQPLHLYFQANTDSEGKSLPGGYGMRPDLSAPLVRNQGADWLDNYFANPEVATPPLNYTLGTAPRELSSARRPGTNTASLSLFKSFSLNRLREGSRLEYRAEAFNAFNHPQFCGPNTTVGGEEFGRVSCQANSPREVQMALKFYW
jgi:hypothetical protein